MSRKIGSLSFGIASVVVLLGALLQISYQTPLGPTLITVGALFYAVGTRLRYHKQKYYS